MHALVDLLAQLGDLRLADPGQSHRLHQIVDPAGRHAADPGLLDYCDQRLLRAPAGFEKRREIAALAQLGDAQRRDGYQACGRGSRCARCSARRCAQALCRSAIQCDPTGAPLPASRFRSEQAQRLRQAPQHLTAAVLELQAGAGNEVANGAGDEDLSAAGQFRDARRDVDSDAADVVAHDFDLAGMEAAAHLDAERPHPLDDCRSAAHGAGGAVERREKAVAEALDGAPAEARDFVPYRLVVPIEQNMPFTVADLRRAPRRIRLYR